MGRRKLKEQPEHAIGFSGDGKNAKGLQLGPGGPPMRGAYLRANVYGHTELVMGPSQPLPPCEAPPRREPLIKGFPAGAPEFSRRTRTSKICDRVDANGRLVSWEKSRKRKVTA